MLPDLHRLFRRELATLRREVEAYPSEADLWRTVPGLPNAAGTLALHLAGNLQHYLGAHLGASGYVRDRPAEFARRDVPRAVLLEELAAAEAAVDRAFERLDPGDLDRPYPEAVRGVTLSVRLTLLHLLAHLAYHLGQVDYHRRGVVGAAGSVDAVSIRAFEGS